MGGFFLLVVYLEVWREMGFDSCFFFLIFFFFFFSLISKMFIHLSAFFFKMYIQ